ncbi:MAG TPA: ABC transporter substrate-binding protein, partial [Comamonas sp.]
VAKLVPLAPHAIVQITTYSASAAFVRAARKAVYGGQMINVSFVGTQALSQTLGAEAEGVMVSQVMPSPFKNSVPMTRAYVDALRASGAEDTANYSGLEGFFAAHVLTTAMRQAARNSATLDREALKAALKAMDGEPLDGFTLDFHSGQTRQRFVELSMLKSNGKVVA